MSAPSTASRWTELMLTAIGAVLIAVPTASAAAGLLSGAYASQKSRGAIAGLVLCCLVTLVSLLVSSRSVAAAFILRAPVAVLLYALGSVLGGWQLAVLVLANIMIFISVILLSTQVLESARQRSVSHLQ